MSTQVQYRRGTSTQNNAFTGALAEITVDTTNNTLRVHDGATAGGFAVVGTTASQTLTNKTLSSPTVTGTITGNLIPAANVTYNLGNSTSYWNNLYLSGNTIFLGSLQLKDNGNNTFAIYTSDGSTQANIDVGSIDVSGITSGTSEIGITAPSGNAYVTVGGVPNILVVTPTGIEVTGVGQFTGNVNVAGNLQLAHSVASGTMTATGNITGGNLNTAGNIVSSGYLFGNGSQLTGIDATSIQNGTSAVSVISSGGNIRSNVAGATVQTLSTGGSNVTGYITASGNITGNYILGNGSQLTGIDATSIQNGSANVRTFLDGDVSLSAAGTANVVVVTSTGANVAGYVNATGNITGGNVDGGNLVSANYLAGTLTTGIQTNITQVGTLTSLAVAGNISPSGISMASGNATIGNLYVSGNTTIAGNITQISGNSGQFFGNATTGFNALYAGVPAGYSLVPQSVVNFISSFDGYSQLNLQNTSAGNLSTSDYILTSDEGDDTTHYVDLGIAGSTYDGTYAEGFNALGNILQPGDGYLYVTGDIPNSRIGNLAVGTPDPNSVTTIFNGGSSIANVSAQFFAPNAAATTATTGTFRVKGGIATTSSIYATGNVSGAYFIGNGSQLTGIDATAIQNGSANVRTFLDGNVTVSAAGTANVVVVTSTGANVAGTLNASGSLTINSSNGATAIVNGGTAGGGNIGASGAGFNTIFAKATSAQYADLAEMYCADAAYEPGTVLAFGGSQEVTISTVQGDTAVAGVISTHPAHLMNSNLECDCAVPLALQGRVPTKVIGTVRKGQMMVSDGNGHAMACTAPSMGSVIGKALEDFDGDSGVIEIVVGRL